MSVSTGTAAGAAPAVTSPCGCAGCGGRPAAGCPGGCSGSCDGGGSDAAFSRPQFFAGMLLSEDDLAAIDEYVVGKRRLTNRYLFGPGVVCGLDVTCAPCDSRSVVVAPGYALDCCGNDIVVACAQTVDVLALLRDLRQRTGEDCGEPCDGYPRQDYYLAVRYTERQDDPMAPYQQDECVVGECEYSRLREGYAFELSCIRPGSPPTLIDRLKECYSKTDDDEVREDVTAMTRAVRVATLQARISERIAAGRQPEAKPPPQREFDALATGTPDVGQAVDLLVRSTTALAADAAHAAGDPGSARLSAPARLMLSSRGPELAGRILGSDELKALPDRERETATRILQVAHVGDVADLTLADRWWLAEGWTPDAAERSYQGDAERVRASVLRRLTASGRTGCAEFRSASQPRFDRLRNSSVEEAANLGKLLLGTLGQCLCDDANPPCPGCADPQVPLAMIKIDGCEVVSVCELERDWVLSPRAVSYWLPVVDVLRKLLLQRCCDADWLDPGRDTAVQLLRRELAELGGLLSAPAEDPQLRDLVSALQEAAGADPGRPGAAPASPATPAATAPSAATPAPADPEARVRALEDQVAALTAQVQALAAAGGGQP